METNRRSLLLGSTAAFIVAATPLRARAGNPLYASARTDRDGQNFAVIFSPSKGDIASVKLPGRAHEITPHPTKTLCVAVGRRPSRSCVAFGPERSPHWFAARDDRHFLGHGVFSPDGRLFYTSENDYDGERGVIGIRDVLKGYKQVGELPSHGIGPHQIALGDGGKTLVINNGGILTHPDMGRKKLNLDSMEPSLVYMDARTGQLKEQRRLAKSLHQLSIRHFAIAPDSTVVLGMQYKGPRTEHPPLIGFHQRGEKIELAQAPFGLFKSMRNYVGSVAIDKTGKRAAATCPRANMVTFWDIETRRLHQPGGTLSLLDGCGVAANGKSSGFVLSSGHGQVGYYAPDDAQFRPAAHKPERQFQWDNHLSRLL